MRWMNPVAIVWAGAVFCCVPICWGASFSDSSAIDAFQMNEVVVSATRVENSRENVSAAVTVITRAEIEDLPVSSVAEVLQYVPGVYMEFNGGPGSFAGGVRIQGSETRQVAIFQDGVPLNQLANPLTDLSGLSINAIERIEVYKGAGSSAWGSGLGGVINIITKEPDSKKPFSADLLGSYGEFDTRKARGSFSGTIDRFGYLISATRDESDGFVAHTAYDQRALYAKLQYDVSDAGRVSLVLSDNDGNAADPVVPFPDFWDDADQHRSYQRLQFETALPDSWDLTVEGRHHRFKNLIEDVYSDHREIYNDYKDETWGGSGRLSHQAGERHRFTIGFDANSGTYDWQGYDRNYDVNTWALYVNDTFRWGRFTVNSALRYDDDSTFGGSVSPVLGVVYHLREETALLRFQVARGFSAPPAAWVHDPTYGNPDLDAETAIDTQLGVAFIPVPALKFEGSLFRSKVDHFINFDVGAMRWENIDKVVRRGGEGAVSVLLPLGLSLSFSGSYVDVRNDITDKVITDIPRTLYVLTASHVWGRLTHSLSGTCTDHNSTFPETADRRFVFNYRFNVALPFMPGYGTPSLFGAVYNIGDSDYLYREVWPKPRRWVEAGVRFLF